MSTSEPVARPTEERAAKAERALAAIEKFVKKQRIGCSEMIYQTDRVIEHAYEFIEELCDIAGYYEDES